MSCISPLTVTVKTSRYIKNIEVPCGHCLNCMIKKQSQLTFLANKELLEKYKNKQSASFVTLTYDDNHIPYNENGFVTLRKKDVQLFLKNLRRNMEYHNDKIPFKVVYCGEYGDGSHAKNGVSTMRPHYHIAFIGLGENKIKKYTRKLWPHGLCDVGPLSSGGIRYICKYMTKANPDKEIKELREVAGVESPFINHSIGLGKKWIEEHLQKIVDDEFTFNLYGKRHLFPKYVMQFVSNHTGVDFHPYVLKYLSKEKLPLAKVNNKSYQEYDYEESFVKYKYKVAALRSQGKPINDITLNKKWIRPNHSHDRGYSELVNQIKFLPYEKTFEAQRKNKVIPRKKIWDSKKLCWYYPVDWDLYLYGDVVPF